MYQISVYLVPAHLDHGDKMMINNKDEYCTGHLLWNVLRYVVLFFLLQPVQLHAADFNSIYEVGPGKSYETPGDVPWENLQASSLILIGYRPQPYACKWVISTTGSAKFPVVVRGVLSETGKRPVISGDNAVTRLELDYWNENRSVLKIGGSSHPGEPPAYITIENLDIRSSRPGYNYTDDSGASGTYQANAAAIHVEAGSNITIRNCILSDSANGFFAGSQAKDLLLEENYIHSNGMENSIYQHNNYTEVNHIIFQFNRFGPLRPGCKGNNLKDRSAGTVIRYNWIEAGSRTIDLVESDHSELVNSPDYRKTYVYGNVLIKHDVEENGQVIHYGGDGGDYSLYRKGMLYFFNNTVISHRRDKTTLFGISSNDEQVSAYNNIIYPTSGGNNLGIMGSKGHVSMHHNWLPEGWKISHEGTVNGICSVTDGIGGTMPGFADFSNDNYHLTKGSSCVDTTSLTGAPDTDIDRVSRPQGSGMDAGAYEYPVNKTSLLLFLNAFLNSGKETTQ